MNPVGKIRGHARRTAPQTPSSATIRILRAVTAGVILLGGVTACKGHEFHPPDRDERVAAALAEFEILRFDTISWENDPARLQAGNEVYATTCRRCHGTVGEGQTDYARTRNLDVPSLVEAEWQWSDSLAALRRQVYTGHAAGMPTFSLSGVTPREIDAVSAYIIYQLRPDVLGNGR
jgi:mono/diheme cytochrome c family protein